MHLPEIDKYAHLNSPLHSWDPRVKIISLLCLVLSIVLVNNLFLAGLGLLLAVALVILSRIPLRFVFLHLRWVILFVLLFFIIMPLTVSGDEIVRFHFFSISRRGLEMASLIGLRALSAVLLIFPMIGTMRFNSTTAALQGLKVPNKLIQMIIFTYRYIFVVLDEMGRMLMAARARGFRSATNVRSLNTFGNIMGMLFVRSYERTEHLHRAMVSRGYDGTLRVLDQFALAKKDFVKAVLVVAAAVGLYFAGWTL
jgi:cobalt/nickel transport system permease protein